VSYKPSQATNCVAYEAMAITVTTVIEEQIVFPFAPPQILKQIPSVDVTVSPIYSTFARVTLSPDFV
jgi:hypothetical protein